MITGRLALTPQWQQNRRRILARAEQAMDRAVQDTATAAAQEVTRVVETETTLRRGLMFPTILARPTGLSRATVSVMRLTFNLGAWQVTETPDGVLVDARVGRGPQLYRGARVAADGQVYLAFGQRLIPVYGPHTDWLFADVIQAPGFRDWLRRTLQRQGREALRRGQS